MILQRRIQGSIEDCFDILAQSYVADANANQRKQLTVKDLRVGNNFNKELTAKLGNKGTVKVVLEKFSAPHEIEISFKSSQGINTLHYVLTPFDDVSFDIEYSENFVSDKKSNNLNYKVMSFLSKRKISKTAKMTLDRLEAVLNHNSAV